MLNKSNDYIYKKCLFPLFAALIGSIWIYVLDTNDDFFNISLVIIAIGLFVYAQFNIKKMVDNQMFLRLIRYILVFTLIFQVSIYAISVVFQGIIALIIAVILLIGFWKIVTY
ncbi:hypothetical protein [Marinilactibacillus sp. Marseille-P9653]|uniref:hypothetical protein n=1 Tax=Marinilactibacillus sp. Marseille-P9653 TaxID=2866583 RepID=UPI001CE3DF3E|nr:hypothetical protein [Marinilactibacillus sp. Marseille-P9653]